MDDRTPGTGTDEETPTDPCVFSAASYWEIGPFQLMELARFLPGEYCKEESRDAHSAKRVDGLGKFSVWYYS